MMIFIIYIPSSSPKDAYEIVYRHIHTLLESKKYSDTGNITTSLSQGNYYDIDHGVGNMLLSMFILMTLVMEGSM